MTDQFIYRIDEMQSKGKNTFNRTFEETRFIKLHHQNKWTVIMMT